MHQIGSEEENRVETSLYEHFRLRGIWITWPILNACLLTLPAAAEIVYTHADVTISGNGRIKIDLNHDGTIDFTIAANDGYSQCYFANEFYGMDTLFPATGNSVVGEREGLRRSLAAPWSVRAIPSRPLRR
jgi:hypothetical protein